MSNLAICRVCLSANVRMHIIINTPLQEVFEKLTNISLTLDAAKPLLACYLCHTYLNRCKVFMDRAQKADALLTELLKSGIVITEESLTPINKLGYNLTSGFCVSPTEYITVIDATTDLDVNDDSNILKYEVPIKFEQTESQGVKDSDTINQTSDHHYSQSDSDDDLPLKSIGMKKKIETRVKRIRVRKKQWGEKNDERRAIGEFAREIILTKEQQLQELQSRAKSLNYLNSPLKCELCFKGFVDGRAYENHREKHDEKSGPNECDICRMRYRTSRQLRTHADTSHGRQYACIKCEHRSHTANQAREHEKWHSGYTYECKLCGQKFRKPTSYLTHMRKRHATQHVCNVCGDSFVTRRGLLMHKSKTHRREDKSSEDPQEPASERFCSECNIQFLTRDAWKRHILSSVKHSQGSGSTLACRICQVHFPSSSILSAHLKEHERALNASRAAPLTHVGAGLECDQCGAIFVNRSKLHAHVKRTHLGVKYNKNIVCEVCGKKCASNATLKYHQRTHTGERPFQCATCPKRFSDNNQLLIHNRTHTGERPYCCAACGRRFSQKPALNRHYRVHTGAKPYICQFCSKTFSQSNSLKLHVRTVHLKLPPNRRNKNQTREVAKKEEETVTLQDLQSSVEMGKTQLG